MNTNETKIPQFDFRKIRAIIDTPDALQTLISKYPEIEVDILSFKENPGCECGRRVHLFLDEKYSIDEDKVFIDSIMSQPDTKARYEGIVRAYENFEKSKVDKGEAPAGQIPPNMVDLRGRVMQIGKTDEDWSNLWNQIIDTRGAYKSFSVLEKEDHLKVYFL